MAGVGAALEVIGVAIRNGLAQAPQPGACPGELDAEYGEADGNDDQSGTGRHEHDDADQQHGRADHTDDDKIGLFSFHNSAFLLLQYFKNRTFPQFRGCSSKKRSQ